MSRRFSAIFLLALAACGPEQSELARQAMADAEAPIFSAAQLESESEVGRWRADPEGPAGWHFAGLEATASELGWILHVEESGPEVVIALELDLAAESADVLELQVDAAPPLGRVGLGWLGAPGGSLDPAQVSADLDSSSGSLRFAVAESDEWAGRIRRLEWRWPRLPDGQRLLLRGLRALDVEPDAQRLAQTLERSWRVDIGRDLRPALLVLPGISREMTVLVPRGGSFRCSLASTGSRPPTSWVLRAIDPVTSRPFELFRERLEGEDLVAWNDREIDLEAYAGREVRLLLEVEAETPWKPGEGLPLWGGPEIVARTAGDPRPDLILVSADTLRADHLSLYGYSRPTSPAIDRWAGQRAVVFRRAIAPAPWTLPSHASLFTGLEALRHGVNYGEPAPASLLTAAEVLREAGYVTYAETGGGYLHPSYGLAQGFDVFRYPASKVPAEGDLQAAIERAIAFIETQPGPTFLFLHSYETHEPYRARPREFERLFGSSVPAGAYVSEWVDPDPMEGYAHRRRFVTAAGAAVGEDHGPVIDIYDSRVAHLDAQLDSLFAWSAKKDRQRGSAVVLTADHGESLGENGRGGHASLEEQILHVPLILALPGGRGAGTEVEGLVRLVDIAPTFYELARLDAGPELDGESLLAMIGGSALPRQAWSASPSTNAGVALESGAWRFQRQAAAWAPEGLARRVPTGPSPVAADPVPAQREILRYLEDTSAGLEMLFSHQGPGSLALELQGSVVQNHRVKSWDAPPGRVTWRGQAKGAGIVLEAGDRWRLVILAQPRGDLELRSASETLWHLDLEVSQLPLTLERSAEGWRRTGAPSPAGTSIRIRWKGEIPASQGAESGPIDEELQRQLQALGYVG